MPKDTFANWLLAGLLATALAGAHLLDTDDMSFEQAQADELQHIQAQEMREERVAKAAASMCGSENAVATQTPDGLQCRTKRGFKTAKLAGVQL